MSLNGPLAITALILAAAVLIGPSLSFEDEVEALPPPTLSRGSDGRLAPAGNGHSVRSLMRDKDGRFHATLLVNGAQVRFLVDTGSSLVALTPEDARRAGLSPGTKRSTARTAGGEIVFAPVTIDRMALGPMVAMRVDAAIVEELPVSLLGQSFLDRLRSVKIEGDQMSLR